MRLARNVVVAFIGKQQGRADTDCASSLSFDGVPRTFLFVVVFGRHFLTGRNAKTS
jgi:hypothetical protein